MLKTELHGCISLLQGKTKGASAEFGPLCIRFCVAFCMCYAVSDGKSCAAVTCSVSCVGVYVGETV